MCSRLARMLHRCLPGSFGTAGRIHGQRAACPMPPSPLPPTKEDAARGADDRPTDGAWFDGEDGDGVGSEVDALGESGSLGGLGAVGRGAENGAATADLSGRQDDGEPSADSRGKEPTEGADDDGGDCDSDSLGLMVAAEQRDVGDVALRAIPARHDSLTLSVDAEESPSRRRSFPGDGDDALWSPGFRMQASPAKRRLSLSRLEDEVPLVEFDGSRTVDLLTAALRVQRLLYGMARMHLRGLGQEQARVLMEGLSAGLRYAREFQAHHGLRAALYSAG